MTSISVVKQIASIFTTSKGRVDAQYAEFFQWYRNIVEELNGDIAAAVGTINVDVRKRDGKVETWGLILSPTDYAFWKEAILLRGVRFVFSLEEVKNAVVRKLSKEAERNALTVDERKALIALLDQPTANV